MTFDEIFEAYYNLYRTDNSIPDSTDDEYAVGRSEPLIHLIRLICLIFSKY